MTAIHLLQSGLAQAMIGALGWALVHFVWQGALVGLTLWCVLALTAGRASDVRYAAACTALFAMMALPALTFVRLAAHAYESVASSGLLANGGSMSISADGGSAVSMWALWVDRMDASMPWLMLAWCAGVLVFSLRLALGLQVVRRLRLRETHAVNERMQQLFERLCVRLQVRQGVALLHSARVHVPTVIGWMKPVVLLPVASLTGFSELQIEALLAHELAHIRRNDYLVSVLQSMVEAVLFYHPVVWWVSRQVRRERECCCDQLAARICGDRVAYARALSVLEEKRRLLPEMALGANGGLLTMRIKRLLGYREEIISGSLAWVLLLAVTVAAGGSIVVRLAHAETAPAGTKLAQAAAGSQLSTPASQAGEQAPLSQGQDGVAQNAKRSAVDHSGASVAQTTNAQGEDLESNSAVADREQLNEAQRVLQKAMLSISDAKVRKQLDDVRRQLNDPQLRRQLQAAREALAKQKSPEAQQHMDAARKQLENQRQLLELEAKAMEELRTRLNSPEFRKQIAQARAAAANIDSAEYRKQLEEIRKRANEFNTPEFQERLKKQVDEAQRRAAAARKNSDKLLASNGAPAAPPPPVPPEAQAGSPPVPVVPVRVSSAVMAGQIIKRVDPIYPPVAKASQVQGTVVLSAIIGKDGSVEKLIVVSGPPMLIRSAIDAVSQWQYKPFLLNGQPIEVATTINVNYTFEGNAPAATPGPQSSLQSEPSARSIPELVFKVEPEYTPQAKAAKVHGVVTLNLVVDKRGLPTHVHVVKGLESSLDKNAVATVEQYRFKPALENGQPVEKAINVEINYQLF